MKSQYITPAVTVFDAQGRLDEEQNHRVYEHLVKGGVTGMVIMGSTGEFFSLNLETSKKLIDMAVPFVKGRMKVYVGASRMDPGESVELANYAHDRGADGVMIISPYYFALSDEAIFNYYDEIAGKTPANIFIYNFPDRTGVSVSVETILALAQKHKNIVGLKDTILDMWHTANVIKTMRAAIPHFEVFSGFDNNFAHNVLAGGAGCIGGLSNIAPEFFARWIKALGDNDLKQIAECQQFVDAFMDIYTYGNPFIPLVKRAMAQRGIINSDVCSKPFLPVTPEQDRKIAQLLDVLNLGKAAL